MTHYILHHSTAHVVIVQPNTPPGDVIFVLKMERHPSFERSNDDLLAKVTITLSEALLGFDRVLLTHLDGRGIRLDGTSSKIIRPNDTIRIPGEGMPRYKTDGRGDLYVVFDVEFPDDNWLRSANGKVSCSSDRHSSAAHALLQPQ